jgi:hypothetical protein
VIKNNIFYVCIGLTVIVFVLFGVSIYKFGFPNQLNEIGDAVAGMAGTLAFIWIAGGLFIQQSELALTREEYQKLRENSDKDHELAFIKLHTASLEHLVVVFSNVFDEITKSIEAIPDGVPKYHKIGLFCDLCIDAERNENVVLIQKIKATKNIYGPVLEKFIIVFNLAGIDKPNNEDVNPSGSFLVNTMYFDIFKSLRKAHLESPLLIRTGS